MRKKVTVIGAGHVGATTAQYIAEMELADVVLVDIEEGLAKGKALDLLEASPVRGFDCTVTGSADYADTAGSDIIIITAGFARKPGMTRDDLLKKNSQVISAVTEKAAGASPESIIIMVTNPLDVMTYLAREVSGFPSNRVVGMAGVLDAARLAAFVAVELKVSVKEIKALVLGGHGDSMVPLPMHCTVSDVPITKLLSEDKISAIVERTRKAGGEIVSLLKTGSAYYSPAASATEMAEAIIKDQKKLLPCAVCPEGEYGLKDIYVGLPAVLGAGGVEKIVELSLTEEEKNALSVSAEEVRENIKKL